MRTYPSVSTWYDDALRQHKLAPLTSPQEVITKQVIDTLAQDTEGKVKQALIDLGWTPPNPISPSLLKHD